jgi:hypothetical protein
MLLCRAFPFWNHHTAADAELPTSVQLSRWGAAEVHTGGAASRRPHSRFLARAPSMGERMDGWACMPARSSAALNLRRDTAPMASPEVDCISQASLEQRKNTSPESPRSTNEVSSA